uniref:Truncated envelope glycoprotein n=1 Tax=Caenorhabditis tropicalis TaxID=1561998 RepID=A0A1I7SYL5_9PELO
ISGSLLLILNSYSNNVSSTQQYNIQQ